MGGKGGEGGGVCVCVCVSEREILAEPSVDIRGPLKPNKRQDCDFFE